MRFYYRITAASLQALTHLAHQLHQNPAETPGYVLRLYPIALERAALLHAIHYEEDFELNTTEMLFNHEMKQIEDDFDKSRTRLRERVLEGLEERRRRAREEKEGEGVVSVGMCSHFSIQNRARHMVLFSASILYPLDSYTNLVLIFLL